MDAVKNRLLSLSVTVSYLYTEYTQKNGAVSLYSPLKPHHSFVYTLYIYKPEAVSVAANTPLP